MMARINSIDRGYVLTVRILRTCLLRCAVLQSPLDLQQHARTHLHHGPTQ